MTGPSAIAARYFHRDLFDVHRDAVVREKSEKRRVVFRPARADHTPTRAEAVNAPDRARVPSRLFASSRRLFPFRSQTEKPRLCLDRARLARLSSDECWSGEVKARVEAYRRDVRRGVNPFEGAFPLWRNEQFVAATTRLKTRGDPSLLASFAEMEREVLLEAQRRELRLLNRRDAAKRGEDAEEERGTCTAIPLTTPSEAAARAECSGRSLPDPHALAAGLGEDDGEEPEVEGDAAAKEGLRDDDDEDGASAREKRRRFPSALSDPAATRDPFLVAAAEAVAGSDRSARKALQLGRRWYDGNRYPRGDEKGARATLPGSNPDGGAEGRAATRSDSGGSGAGGIGGSGSGSGSGEATPARHLAAFTRPPKLILYPDGSMGEAPVPGTAASGPPLAPTASLEASGNNAAPPPGFPPAPFGSANAFAYPAPWAHALGSGGQVPPTFAAAAPPNAMAFDPNGTGFPAMGLPAGLPAGFPPGFYPGVPTGFGFPPHPAALFGFPPAFVPGAPFPPAAPLPAPRPLPGGRLALANRASSWG